MVTRESDVQCGFRDRESGGQRGEEGGERPGPQDSNRWEGSGVTGSIPWFGGEDREKTLRRTTREEKYSW